MLAVALMLCASSTSAQYFGRNKVQYKHFDFQVLATEHFDIYYYPEARDGIDIAARLAERWHTRLERLFAHQLRGRQPLVLYASHVDFEQTNTIQGELGEGTGGVTEGLRRRIILPLGGPLADTDHVIGHELVHAFQYDITTTANMTPGQNGAERLPLWFIEGMAEYFSLGPVDPNTAMWIRDAARKEQLPAIEDLDDPDYFPYRWGQAFWAYVGGRWGDGVVRDMLSVAAGSDTDQAIERVLGIKTTQLSDDWHVAIRQAYASTMASTTPPSETGTLVIKGQKLGGDLNLGPAISPDGRWIAFLSERGLFSIDLYIANAATGRVVRKLTSTANDPHYSSIQFIHSAGGWDADSRRIAIATVTSGRPALAIFDAQSGRRERELTIADVDEIFNPTWSRDGRAICFTGMTRGLTDLFIVELSSGVVRQLTHDAFADLQPAWSPDGRRLAFATDRFSTRLDTLDIGDYQIGVMDIETGQIQRVSAFANGKHINPQWSPDGGTLYFIADRDGIPNLYRVPAQGGAVTQLTNVLTGLSGITTSSPALSVSSQTGLAAFTVYDEGRYDIYTRTAEQVEAIRRAPPQATPPVGAVLPPIDRRPSEVQQLLSNSQLGLPAGGRYESAPYRPRLAIDAIGQPTVAVGTSSFGTSIGGGIAASFSDTLGDQNLATVFQINSGLNGSFSPKDTAVQAQYLNQAHRWNWGIVGGQVPYSSGGVVQTLVTVNNEPSLMEETILVRQTELSAAGLVAYPFNRAQRIEFHGGARRMSLDRVTRTQLFSLITGELFADETNTSAVGAPLTLGTSSAALVFDTSNFGATSPVQGQRYRIEGTPTFGAINFTSVLADYRRYAMPVSFYTIAARVMHYGRYGAGGQDERLSPLYVGYANLVRGYDVNSIDPRECVANALSACPVFDNLVGSRLLVGNLEFRFPLFRPFTGPSRAMYGPLPLELGLFVDGGVAWNRGERPEILGGARRGVSSTGFTLRANLLGFAIGEFTLVRPLQRPQQGWIFQFNLSPGF